MGGRAGYSPAPLSSVELVWSGAATHQKEEKYSVTEQRVRGQGNMHQHQKISIQCKEGQTSQEWTGAPPEGASSPTSSHI